MRPPSSKRIGVLFSGGLDSAALIGTLLRKGFEVWPVYIHCGLGWEKPEITWAKRFLKAMSSPQLRSLTLSRLLLENAYEKNWSRTGRTPGSRSRDEAVFLPARNLLLSIKALLALSPHNITQLALATLRGNPFPDGNAKYYWLLEKTLTASFNQKIQVKAPYKNLTKFQILRMNKRIPLYLTLSCINPHGIYHCGKCNKCAERKRAFKKAGREDKTIYRA